MPDYNATAVIPWKNRPELKTSLGYNAAIFNNLSIKVVIVNCGGDNKQLKDIVRTSGITTELIYLPTATFNRSLALNIGSYYSSSDLLFLVDADVLANQDSLVEAIAYLKHDNNCVITIKELMESIPEHTPPYFDRGCLKEVTLTQLTHFVWSNGSTTSVPNWRSNLQNGSQGGQGQLIVKRQDLLRIGGYDSEFVGWGFEDIDVLIRLQHVLHARHEQIGEATHISHGDDIRNIDFGPKHVTNRRNRLFAFAKYGEGQFDGSILKDNHDWSTALDICRVVGNKIVPLPRS